MAQEKPEDLFTEPPRPPKTSLGRYRILAPSAGIRVSPLQLGGMSIGDAHAERFGAMDKTNSFKLLDAFADAGGNFIDTANNYQDGQSETWIGEWMKQRNNRDQMVIATKYTTPYMIHELGKAKSVNYCGNHKRSLHMSVRDSLKKLQTDWIDILYVHWWEYTTTVEEVMDSLHALVEQGKVLYLGVSDTPAWVVAKANQYARDHGKTSFVIYQGLWNCMQRDFEREIIPLCRNFGMALAPWGAVGSGKFQSKKELEKRKRTGEPLRRSIFNSADQTPEEVRMSEALAKVAEEHGIESVTAIALAYVMAKAPYVFPIVGGRKVEHLEANIKALDIKLTPDQVKSLESVVSFDLGFPQNLLGADSHIAGGNGQGGMLNMMSNHAFVRAPTAIGYE